MRKKILKLSYYINTDNIIISLGIITIVPFLIISIFDQPSIDDYLVSFKSQNLGFWNVQKYWYFEWTGRYFSSFLMSINPLVFNNFFIYKLIPIVVIISLFLSLYYLFSLIFPNLKIKEKIILCFSFIIIFFFQMPDITQGFYWLSGTVTYQLANIFTILLLSFLIKLIITKKIKFLIFSIFLSFAIIGSNETSMLILDFILFTIFLLNYFINKKLDSLLLTLLIFAGIFSTIVIFAPGNKLREIGLHNKHHLIFSIVHSYFEVKSAAIKWSHFVILFIIIIFYFLDKYNIDINSKIFNFNPILGFVFLCLIFFLGFFPGFWSLGHRPPPRTVNVIYFFFLFGFIYFICLINFYLKKKGVEFLYVSQYIRYLIIILIIFNLYKPNNIRTVYEDLISGKAYYYDIQLRNRYEIIKNSKSDTCYVPKLQNVPQTIYVLDITTDANNDINKWLSEYMKLKSIKLMKDN